MITTRVTETLSTLQVAMAENFKAAGYQNFCLLTIMPGEQVPLNYCEGCNDGMGWVRLAGMGPPEDSLEQAPDSPCYALLSMTIEVGHVFGAPWPDSDGELPPAEEHHAAALRQIESADILLQSLICSDLPGMENVARPAYVPIGPDGGCVGGMWTGTVRLM